MRTLVAFAILALSVLAAGISSTQTFEPRTYARSSGGGSSTGTTVSVYEAGGEGGPVVTVRTVYGIPYGIAVHVALVAGPYGTAADWETIYGDTAGTDTTHHTAQEYASFTAVDFDTLLWVVTLQASDTEFHRVTGSGVIDCASDCLPPSLADFAIASWDSNGTALAFNLSGTFSEVPVQSVWQYKKIGGEYSDEVGASFINTELALNPNCVLLIADFADADSLACRIKVGDFNDNWSAYYYDVVDIDRAVPPDDVTPAVITLVSVTADSAGIPEGADPTVRVLASITLDELATLRWWWRHFYNGARADSAVADTIATAATLIFHTGLTTTEAAGDTFHVGIAAADTAANESTVAHDVVTFTRAVP